jgi:hypothetical protein
VGFKVNSARAVQFRKWVNKIAKDYTIQGWVMDADRLFESDFDRHLRELETAAQFQP